jgi:acyl-CoA reductase-like NAD-dependent aldehyde dehydrogenase
MDFGDKRASAVAAGVAVDAARRAQQTWSELGISERLRVVRRFRQHLAGDLEAVLRTLSRAGRHDQEALVAEIVPLADACRFLERHAAGLLRPRRPSRRGRPAWLMGVSAEVRREPFGIVLVVAPANYPLLLPGVQLLQAVVAGNGVVVKPAPEFSAPMALMAEWLVEAGLPRGLVQVVGEGVEEVSDALDAGVDKVVLTGSAGTGLRIAVMAAERLVPTTMELSGNDAVFVLPGANLDLVARALTFGLRFNGSETCIAPRRVFVPQADAEALERALARRLPEVPARPIGPAARRQAMKLVGQAIAAGARPVGGPPDEAMAETAPVVLAEARPEMALLKADVFAPVLAIVPVADMDEALEMARQSPYALGASVFGPAVEAEALAARVDAGSVTVNDIIVPTADPRLPFGGRRRSGWGVTRGAEGLLEMTQVKTVSVRRHGPRFHFDPPRSSDQRLLAAAFRAMHGAGAGRWRAIRALVGAVREARQRRER